MANDRLYIKCKQCHKNMVAAKSYGSKFVYDGEALIEFMNTHLKDCNDVITDFSGDGCFEFFPESSQQYDREFEQKLWEKI